MATNISGERGSIDLNVGNAVGDVSWTIDPGTVETAGGLIGFSPDVELSASNTTSTSLEWYHVPAGTYEIKVTATDSRPSECCSPPNHKGQCTSTETFILTVEEDQTVWAQNPNAPWLQPQPIFFPADLQKVLPVYYQGSDYDCTVSHYYAFDEWTLPRFILYAKTQAAVERVLRVASGDAVTIQSSIVSCGASHMHESIFRCSPDAPFIDIHQGDSVRPVCSLTVNIVDMGQHWSGSFYHAYEVTFSGYAEFKTCGSPGYVAGIYFPMGPDDLLASAADFILTLYCKNLKRT